MTPVTSPVPDSGRPGVVGDLSESELLAGFVPLLSSPRTTLVGPGDDCAVLAAPDGRVAVSTDVLVEDVHFIRSWSTAREVGRRAAAQNLADAAAVGAVPTGLVVSLVLPRDLPVAWVEDLARGLDDVCRQWGAGVVGGDLAGGPLVVVAVTVLGDLEGRAPVLRSGARPGDVVAHAGVRGRSAAGLALLGAGLAGDARVPDDVRAVVLDAFRSPSPPVAAGRDAAIAGATAMLDVSDGLLRDAGRIASASGVRLALDDPADVLADELALLAPVAATLGEDATRWVLSGGEDHGLLATFPSGTVLPDGFRVVGRVDELLDDDGALVTVAGRSVPAGGGWDHFGPGKA